MNTKVVVDSNARRVESNLKQALEAAVGKVAASIEGVAKQELQRMVYSRPESGDYQRTGNLMNSIRQHEKSGTAIEVSADAEYAVMVHEGTRRQSPKPFLANALRKVKGDIEGITETELRIKGFR